MSIITLRDAGVQTWQWHLQHAVRDTASLCSALDLALPATVTDFPLLVPLPYLSRIEPGNPEDPLLRQVLPTLAEAIPAPGFSQDPLAEQSLASSAPGLLQKYQGRVLVISTGACAVNCRYCFRRHYPYSSRQPDWQALLQQVSRDETVQEVILSGGDPLLLNDRRLTTITQSLAAIPHVRSLRIHTRLPIVIPQRVCDDLLAWVRSCEKPIVMVMHINHPREIDEHVRRAMQQLKQAGVTLLNQSVLLKHVNDKADTLAELSHALFDSGVLPYYLHLLDPVQGAAHFEVPEATGRKLMAQLSTRLPGYLVPRLVREEAGAASKTLRYPAP